MAGASRIGVSEWRGGVTGGLYRLTYVIHDTYGDVDGAPSLRLKKNYWTGTASALSKISAGCDVFGNENIAAGTLI